jgi:hypothetical protein
LWVEFLGLIATGARFARLAVVSHAKMPALQAGIFVFGWFRLVYSVVT